MDFKRKGYYMTFKDIVSEKTKTNSSFAVLLKYAEYDLNEGSGSKYLEELFDIFKTVPFKYEKGHKWILSRKINVDASRIREYDFIPWTKDYVSLYVKDLPMTLTKRGYNKLYSYLTDISNWPEDRIID